MKILVACEFSGRVREAFRALGHDAWSADILPAEDDSRWHIQGDVRPVLRWPWDLVVAHPPCTYLCNSGVRWLYHNGRKVRARWQSMRAARDFFAECLYANSSRVCVENPVPHRHAELPAVSQWVQPWQFGDPESKRTGLWLRGLPCLVSTHAKPALVKQSVHRASPGPERWRERSRTFPGIAQAFAMQWGSLSLA